MSKWPSAEINQFGSYAIGLSTFLSDLDISILGMGVDTAGDDKQETEVIETTNSEANGIMFTDVINSSSRLAAMKENTTALANKTKHHKYIAESSADVELVSSAVTASVDEIPMEEEVVSWVIDKKGTSNGGISFAVTSSTPSNAKVDNTNSAANTPSRGVKRKAEVDLQEESIIASHVEVVDLAQVDSTSHVSQVVVENKENTVDSIVSDTNEEDKKEEEGDDSSDDSESENESDNASDSSECIVNLDAINRMYEREERALGDVDIDDCETTFDELHAEFHGSDDGEGEYDEEGDWDEDAEEDAAALLEECGLDLGAIEAASERDRVSNAQRQTKRTVDREEDDQEYYSDGDVYNIHKQNDLFKSIKMAILAAEPELCVSSVADEMTADSVVTVTTEPPQKVSVMRSSSDAGSGYSSSNGGSFVDLAALNDTSSEEEEEEGDDEDDDSESEEEEEGSVEHQFVAGGENSDEDDQMSDEDGVADSDEGGVHHSEGDDFDHSLLDVGLAPGGLDRRHNDDFSLNVGSGGNKEEVDKEAEARRHKKQLILLRAVFPHLKILSASARCARLYCEVESSLRSW
eukprot:gene21834-27905_t